CPKRFYSDVGEYTGSGGGYGGKRVLRVRVGDTDLGSSEDDEFAQQIPIARMVEHPRYRASRKYFDVALIELQWNVEYTSAVCPACLWQEKDLPDGPMEAIGFGATGFGEALSPTLQRVVLNHIGRNECMKKVTVNKRTMPEGFRTDQFCAAGSNMDTCEGDSGGPIGVKLLDVGGQVIPLVAGVVSFGTPCIEGSTGVYTKISEYIGWIERETNTSHSYAVCSKTWYCAGRPTKYVPIRFDSIYTKSRFGLLWSSNESEYECGATLIDYQFLLTTASCVSSTRGHPNFVISSSKEQATIVDVYVAPLYRPGRSENDIALIKIDKFVNYTVYRPSCLWDRRTNGDWPSGPKFSAYGPVEDGYRTLALKNYTISVTARNGTGCEREKVAIGWTRDGGKIDYLCGGSLISETFVLTAAHCYTDANRINPDTVRIGDTDLGSTEDDEFAQQIPIARIVRHPQYRASRKYFDVALIELQWSVEYTSAVCPACLWQEKELPDGPMEAIGFGATGFGEALSPTLQRVVLSHVELSECVKRVTVHRREMPEGFRADQFCAASDTMDTCEGDSGGPIGVKLLDVGGSVNPLVTGVVSFGTPCIEGSTGVYTKISEYIDWIEQETNTSHSYTDDELANILDVYVFPRYKPGSPENDIALVKIAKYVNYTVYRPACLWDRNTDGDWSLDPTFSAYGPGYDGNRTISITAWNGTGCEREKVRGTDLRCYNNTLALVPGVCSMDYGAPVFDKSFWGDPLYVYGVVSPLSKGCGSNLFMIDVTPHIAWIESIIVGRRDQYLVFSD
uniref:Peptidase S1 domain-containing protein n=1 Tax=Anopheles farauti TaxID=69004 RepID=A0A182QQ99_9DIPT